MSKADVARSFLNTLGKVENTKGLSAEEKALEALLFHYPEEPWIKLPRKATLEEDTLLGIDLVVETFDIGKLFIQIKSSDGAMRRYLEKRRRIMIAVVVIKTHEDRSSIWIKLKRALTELRGQILTIRGD